MPRVCVLGFLLLLSGCSFRTVGCGVGAPPAAGPADAPAPAVSADPTAAPATFKILFLGDSVTAGLGLLSQQAYPALVEDMFSAEGYRQIEVVNAGISGDTTAGGRRRVEALLDDDVRILVIELGGNDALRGLSATNTRENLAAIVQTAVARDLAVVLTGMEAPPNYGEDYRDAFRAAFVQVARDYRTHVVFVPFILEGVAGRPELNQPDGIHPNEKGATVIAEMLYPKLRTIVDQLGGG